MTKPTKWVCAQRRLESAWASAQSDQCLCCALSWVAKNPSFLHADSEDSDQLRQMPRLIRVLARRSLILLVLSCRGSFHEFLWQFMLVKWLFFCFLFMVYVLLRVVTDTKFCVRSEKCCPLWEGFASPCHFSKCHFSKWKNLLLDKGNLIWFLFYDPSTHFRSFRARSVTLTTLFLASLLGSLPVFSAHSFAINWQLLFLN